MGCQDHHRRLQTGVHRPSGSVDDHQSHSTARCQEETGRPFEGGGRAPGKGCSISVASGAHPAGVLHHLPGTKEDRRLATYNKPLSAELVHQTKEVQNGNSGMHPQVNIKRSWVTSIDLKDAYLHIPIHPSHPRWLQFSLMGQAYAFRCLPFGLSTAPWVFTRVVLAVVAYLRHLEVHIFMYLDDWLVLSPSESMAKEHTQLVLQTTEHLGSIINRAKSHLTPTKRPSFLGATLDLVHGVVTPSQKRVDKLIS